MEADGGIRDRMFLDFHLLFGEVDECSTLAGLNHGYDDKDADEKQEEYGTGFDYHGLPGVEWCFR